MIEMLYLVVLSRRPSLEELNRMTELVGEHPDSPESYRAVFWVLLNSTEFILKH